ncbi:unnamed protein product [Durusdinium trenchii]|uniref:Uncharacterized protein n=1 Tax=Durusdinium trenchii TaxID=1381693 RepID=A0ABP0LSV9_9DINO
MTHPKCFFLLFDLRLVWQRIFQVPGAEPVGLTELGQKRQELTQPYRPASEDEMEEFQESEDEDAVDDPHPDAEEDADEEDEPPTCNPVRPVPRLRPARPHAERAEPALRSERKERKLPSQMASSVLYNEVPGAVEAFVELEVTWSKSELSKRMLKYFTGGLTATEGKGSWAIAARKFLEKGLRSFSNACKGRKWFARAGVVLKPVLAKAAWELIQDCDNVSECSIHALEHLVDEVYMEMTEYQNFEVAVHKAVLHSFGDQCEEVQQKLMTALHRTHEGVQKELEQANNQADIFAKVEAFAELWVNKSMERAAVMVNPEILTETAIVELFKLLLAPEFSDTYSCVPPELREGGRPKSWRFLRLYVREMLERWDDRGESPRPRKRPMPV